MEKTGERILGTLVTGFVAINEATMAGTTLNLVKFFVENNIHDLASLGIPGVFSSILLSRMVGNMVKAVSIFDGKADKYFDWSGKQKKRFPVLAHILLPIDFNKYGTLRRGS